MEKLRLVAEHVYEADPADYDTDDVREMATIDDEQALEMLISLAPDCEVRVEPA